MTINYVQAYDQLMRFAAHNPEMVGEYEPVFDYLHKQMHKTRQASRSKFALSEKTARMVNYITLAYEKGKTPAVSPRAAQEFLERNWKHLELQVPETRQRGGPRFKRGDLMKVDASKHKISHTMDIYKAHDGMKGSVVATPAEDRSLEDGSDHGDIIVKFDNGQEVRLPDAMKSRGVGVSKDNGRQFKDPGGALVEFVYFSQKDRPPTKEQMLQVEEYLEKGRALGEDRVPYYYSGIPTRIAMSKDGQFYFQIRAQQRGKNPFRTYNPEKGTLLYIGRMPFDRPKGWEREYTQLLHS